MRFKDRFDAGEQLAQRLQKYSGSALVLGIPRGGVLTGCAIAKALVCRLGVLVARKLPVPGEPEVGFGAVTEDGPPMFNAAMLQHLALPESELERIVAEVRKEIGRRVRVYGKMPDVAGRNVIVADDGLATGYTMLAAIKYLKMKNKHGRTIAAVPVATPDALALVQGEADEAVCLHVSESPVFAVGAFYDDFHDVPDSEVLECLQ